jgi:hypothetical protein
LINAFAPAYAIKDLWFLIYAILGNEDRDRFADDLFGSIAEQPLGTATPTCDDAVKSFADNRIY